VKPIPHVEPVIPAQAGMTPVAGRMRRKQRSKEKRGETTCQPDKAFTKHLGKMFSGRLLL
jgi:hypothetical protein